MKSWFFVDYKNGRKKDWPKFILKCLTKGKNRQKITCLSNNFYNTNLSNNFYKNNSNVIFKIKLKNFQFSKID